jgi:uncharacterized protein involved in outer membrane biogenesis
MASLTQARLRRTAAVAFTLVTLLGAALLWVPEATLRYSVRQGASLAGLQLAGLEKASLSLSMREGEILLGAVEFMKLHAAGTKRPDTQMPGLRVDTIDLRFDWRKLLAGRLELPSLRVRGLALELERNRDGGFAVSGVAVGGGTAAPSEPARGAGESLGFDWPIGIDVAEILDSTLVYRDGDRTLALRIESLRIERFAFDTQPRKVRFALDGTLADASFSVRGTADLGAPSFEGNVEVAGLALAAVASKVGLELGGVLAAKLDVAVSQQADGPMVALVGMANLEGLTMPGTTAAAATWNGRTRWQAASGFSFDGALTVRDFKRIADAGTLAGEAITYRGTAVLGPQGAFELRGGAELASVAVAAGAAKLRAGTVALARLDLSLAPSGRILFGGNPALRDVAFEQGTMSFAAQSLAADGTASHDAGTLLFDGSIEMAVAKFDDDEVGATLAQLRYRGALVRQGDAVSSNGMLGLVRGSASASKEGLAISFGELRHEGRAAVAPVPALAGRLAASDFTLDAADGRTLAAIGRVTASDLAADAVGTQAPRVEIENLRLLRRVAAGAGQPAFPWRLEAARASLRDLRLEGMRAVAVNAIQIERPLLRLTRTKEGWLSLDAKPSPPASAPSSAATPTPVAAPAPLRYTVGRLSFGGGRAVFEDRAPHAPVRLALDRIEADIVDIDNMRPERPVAFSLSTRVGGFGQATAQGTAAVFAPLLSFDLELVANAIDLPPLSSYVDQALGIDLRTGTADVAATLNARDEQLAGTTKWRFANLRIDERARAADEPAPKLPVATVLGLLADADGTIALDIPVAGPLRDPQFDTADAVRQAVGGAIDGALSTTFSVLFPFGVLVSNAIESERRGTSVVLPALAFADGKSDIEAAASEQLQALANFLEKRPAAQLEVCGFAKTGEIEKADAADLEALAGARSTAVKARLIEGGKVAATRVFECRPLVDASPNANARVELRFL